MANLNKVMLMGNLTRDIELRTTPSGQSVGKFGLAVNRVWYTPDGEKKEEVTFVDCDVWGKQAETMAKYLSKGRGVFIEGRLKLDQWDDKETGQKRSKMGVVVESFQFIGARPDGQGGGGGGGGDGGEGGYVQTRSPRSNTGPAGGSRPSAPRQAPPPSEPAPDDIPF
jgi:single-strand DNA-binding protein